MTTDFFVDQAFDLVDRASLAGPGKFAFTVDVEEWFQVGAFETTFSRTDWLQLESRVEVQTRALLDLLSNLNVTGTFFALGWVAERCPELIQQIVGAGHELGCHGMDHRRLFTMPRAEFRDDIRKAKALLEQASGTDVVGYRAPSFSLVPEVWWAYEELAEAGFQYSSSLYPVKTDHYGASSAPRTPFFPLTGNDLIEIPMTVCDLTFRRLPASGGGYFRLLPYGLSIFLMKRGQKQTGVPGLFYMHPWEMDLGQPFVRTAPLLSKFRHYTGQKRLPAKLAKLAHAFSWGRIDHIYANALKSSDESL